MENTKCKPLPAAQRSLRLVSEARPLLALWVPVFVYAGILFYLSSIHHPSTPKFPYSDKVYHAILYSGFGFLFVRALRPMQKHWRTVTIVLVASIGAVFYGMTDEFHQIFVSGRTAEWADVVLDGVGGLLGGGIYVLTNYVDQSRRRGKIQADDQAVASL